MYTSIAQTVTWYFGGVELVMWEIDGALFCTTGILTEALGCSRQNISQICKRYLEHLGPNSVNSKLTEASRHKFEQAISSLRGVRSGETLFSESQVVFLAMSTRSAKRFSFVSAILDLVKGAATKGRLTRQELESLTQQLTQAKEENARYELSTPIIDRTASLVGQTLRAYREVKKVRGPN